MTSLLLEHYLDYRKFETLYPLFLHRPLVELLALASTLLALLTSVIMAKMYTDIHAIFVCH